MGGGWGGDGDGDGEGGWEIGGGEDDEREMEDFVCCVREGTQKQHVFIGNIVASEATCVVHAMYTS